MKTLAEAWEGVMITYQEQDFPTSEPYARRIPGWKCRGCGWRYGSAGLPPRRCQCGAEWAEKEPAPPARVLGVHTRQAFQLLAPKKGAS